MSKNDAKTQDLLFAPTVVKALRNHAGTVVGRTETYPTGEVVAFWEVQPRLRGQWVAGETKDAQRAQHAQQAQQLRTLAAPLTEPPQRWRCPQCLAYLSRDRDENGQYRPCTTCGYSEWVGPSPAGTDKVPDTAVPVQFSAPETLARVTALQADPHLVAEAQPVFVQAVRLAPPTARQTYAPVGTTLDRVVTAQTALGQREAPEAPLRTMQSNRCPRCGAADYRTCPCPPAAPMTLEAAVTANDQRRARQDAADLACYPHLKHWLKP
jgi:hypothetical protein